MKPERFRQVSAGRARVARRAAALPVLLVVRPAGAAGVGAAGGPAPGAARLLLGVAALGGRARLGVHLVLRGVLALVVHAQPVPPAGRRQAFPRIRAFSAANSASESAPSRWSAARRSSWARRFPSAGPAGGGEAGRGEEAVPAVAPAAGTAIEPRPPIAGLFFRIPP